MANILSAPAESVRNLINPTSFQDFDLFDEGIEITREQGLIAEAPTSVIAEVMMRVETWRDGSDPETTPQRVHPATILGIFAEVSAQREALAARDFTEYALSTGYGGTDAESDEEVSARIGAIV